MPRSIEQIEAYYKGQNLRVIVREMMKANPKLIYSINGLEFTPGKVGSHGKKPDLIRHISLWESQGLLDKNITEPVTVIEELEPVTTTLEPTTKPAKVTINQESEYTQSEAERLAIAKKIYYSKAQSDELTGLQEYHLKLCQQNKYFLPEFAILVARSRIIIENYADSVSPNGKAHPGSVIALKVAIVKYIKEFVDIDNNKFPPVNDRQLADTFEDFDTALRGAFKDISSLKTKMYSANNAVAEADVRSIQVCPFIDWAVATVSNLSNNSAKWREVAIAVMLLTGRRQSEVMSSGIFEYADDSHVIFEGQLKRHIDELVAPEKIPVLGNAAKQVVDAIAWLETHDKRSLPTERTAKAIQEAAKKSHNRCSRYIAEQMDLLTPFVTITNGKAWTFTKDGKTVNKFKGHLTRQIYAQVCEKLFSDSDNEKKQSFIARILLEGRDAAVAYDRDIEIKYIEVIKAKYGNVN
ncbi:MAG: telomere resolvase [Spirirestis rafaelensis WJT71-NPBG6]|jgi:hypothetical protein|nr:telomere resolvase [Spirirestis rafaelensis WJT71-NPBG6]